MCIAVIPAARVTRATTIGANTVNDVRPTNGIHAQTETEHFTTNVLNNMTFQLYPSLYTNMLPF